MMGPIKPGDRFFRVQNRNRSRAEKDWVVITKVGRKWAEFRSASSVERWPDETRPHGRFDLETLVIDAGQFSSPSSVFATEEEYSARVRGQALWKDLRDRIDRSYRKPDSITEIQILKAADALGFRLKEE